MAKANITPMTADQKTAARKSKADADKARRAQKAAVVTALERAGLEFVTTAKTLTISVNGADLTKEQKERAATYTAGHGGLTGKALAAYILDGKTSKQQVEESRATTKKVTAERKNLSRSNDPAATELAQKAAALAPEVKSAFLPKDARECLDVMDVTRDGMFVVVKRKGVDLPQDVEGVDHKTNEVRIKREDLEGFAIGGNKDKDVRKLLAVLAKDSRLWGRKLGLMLLVRAAI